MSRYLLTVSYLGTNFCGWQVQPNGRTVQQVLGDALSLIFGTDTAVTGCSRTDSGVHARQFCCHFDADADITEENIICAVNNNTPADFSCYSCKTVENNFHARYNCLGKNYIYRILNSKYLNPFEEGRALWYKYPLNISKMQSAASLICGEHDFTSFCAAGSSVKDKVRTVTECSVKDTGNGIIEISVSANGFLYNMVRIIAGTLIKVGSGKIEPQEITEIINKKNRNLAGYTAPAHGLYLNKVFY